MADCLRMFRFNDILNVHLNIVMEKCFLIAFIAGLIVTISHISNFAMSQRNQIFQCPCCNSSEEHL